MARQFTETDRITMDQAAEAAAKELKTLNKEAVASVAVWWKNHYMKAGHKRLGRALVATVKK